MIHYLHSEIVPEREPKNLTPACATSASTSERSTQDNLSAWCECSFLKSPFTAVPNQVLWGVAIAWTVALYQLF